MVQKRMPSDRLELQSLRPESDALSITPPEVRCRVQLGNSELRLASNQSNQRQRKSIPLPIGCSLILSKYRWLDRITLSNQQGSRQKFIHSKTPKRLGCFGSLLANFLPGYRLPSLLSKPSRFYASQLAARVFCNQVFSTGGALWFQW